MTKVQRPISITLILLLSSFLMAAQNHYRLLISGTDRDSAYLVSQLAIQTTFTSKVECEVYVTRLPAWLHSKGFVTASVDSVFFDTAFARIELYLGKAYQWSSINVDEIDPVILYSAGWNSRQFTGRTIDMDKIFVLQEKMLSYLENNGYPFARIYLDSLIINEDSVSAVLKTDLGPLYKIDSLRVFGEARVSNKFLQQYLDLPEGSIYNKQKLMGISGRIRELSFLEEEQPSDLSLLGTGSVLNLYLKPRKSNQVNALIGFLPNNNQLAQQKLLVTGEANINLRNAFGSGEVIGLNWQQIQVSSPRLNIIYQQPFLFSSPLGIDFSFDMFKKDSSFLNVNFNLGASYAVSANKSGKLFLQRVQTIVSQGGVNSAKVISTRRLPDVADLSATSLGLDYFVNKTDYRLNPKKGTEYRVTGSAGLKRITKNNEILELKDPGDPSFDFERLYDTVKLKTYQVRISGMIARYFPMGRQGTIRTALNGGLFQSEQIYRNELFQIGGFKLLRGFDEESQYVSQYLTATLEYRYLIGINSYFFVFTDGGWARNSSRISRYSHTYISTGLGMAFETKAGIFNLAWALGSRNDAPFNLRQSKIHVGFMNFF